MRQIRFLQAWMPREEAIATSLGRGQLPADDVAQCATRWEAAQEALQGRTPFDLAVPQLEDLPPGFAERAQAFRQRADVLAAFQGLDWTLGVADLERVLSFQKIVVEDHAIDRVADVEAEDIQSLFSVCLPDPAAPASLECAVDADHKGLTFFSSNPNLRFGGHAIQQAEIPGGPGQPTQTLNLAGFIINLGLPFIQIAESNNRWFVRDGYHRCYGFLRRGIRRIPCAFIRARSLDELGANQPAFLRPELLFGERPPFLRDFLDDRVSATAQHRDIRKIVRISAQEFLIQL
jgi:hypothetical protein